MEIKKILLTMIIFSNVAFAKEGIELNNGKTNLIKNPTMLSRAVGQMMMVGFNGVQVDENSAIIKEIKQYHIGGIILDQHRQPNSKKYTTNIENPTQLKNLIKKLQFYAKKYDDYPLFIAVNQEGGMINTLKVSQGFNNANDPSQFELGKTRNQQIIFNAAFKRGMLLKSMGVNLNLAPVADLNINPNNPAVGKLQRSFGNNPQYVIQDLKSTIKAYNKASIFCTLKHFPGLGSASKNTDYDNADLSQTWNKTELMPYKELIQSKTNCPFIMVAHLVNKHLDKNGMPASLSKNVITDLLIKKLHYTGLIITDDMDAASIRNNFSTQYAIKKAVLAGNDVIIYGGTQGYDPDKDTQLLFNTLMMLADKNPEIYGRVLKSYEKIIKLKQSLKN